MSNQTHAKMLWCHCEPSPTSSCVGTDSKHLSYKARQWGLPMGNKAHTAKTLSLNLGNKTFHEQPAGGEKQGQLPAWSVNITPHVPHCCFVLPSLCGARAAGCIERCVKGCSEPSSDIKLGPGLDRSTLKCHDSVKTLEGCRGSIRALHWGQRDAHALSCAECTHCLLEQHHGTRLWSHKRWNKVGFQIGSPQCACSLIFQLCPLEQVKLHPSTLSVCFNGTRGITSEA